MDIDSPETKSLLMTQIDKIMDAISTDDQITALNETDLLLKTFGEDNKIKYDVKSLEKNIESWLNESERNRRLRLNARLKQETETAIEYYDKDIGTDERLFYKINTEKSMMKINRDIKRFLAELIKTKLNEDFNLD